MSEHVRGDGAASDREEREEREVAEQVPEIGAVRINDEGLVEHYDGTAWRPYGELPDDGGGPAGTWQFRNDDRDDRDHRDHRADRDGPARP